MPVGSLREIFILHFGTAGSRPIRASKATVVGHRGGDLGIFRLVVESSVSELEPHPTAARRLQHQEAANAHEVP